MDELYVAVTTLFPRSRKFRRFLGRFLLAGFAVVIALALDIAPSVPPSKAPNAEQARRARDVALTVQRALRDNNGLATVRFNNDDLASATTLTTDIRKFGRFDSMIGNRTLTLRNSRRFGFIWLNGEATLSSSLKGFPEIRLKIGQLPLGPSVSRWVIDTARSLIRWRGVKVPPLDDLVRKVDVQPDSVSAQIYFPLGSASASDLSALRSQPVDAALTALLYCRSIALNRTAPTNEMALVVRRTFAPTASTLAFTEQNRAAFVALAIYVTGRSAGRLAGDAAKRVNACRAARTEPFLVGRTDLAKHWALSAALTVALGDEIGTAMGEWKELSDSRPGGSGFSFVDLAADRAGIAIAKRATDPTSADDAVAQLRLATDNDLLPVRALALSEGLSERDFVTSYRAIDSARFAAAKARIDHVIAQTVGR